MSMLTNALHEINTYKQPTPEKYLVNIKQQPTPDIYHVSAFQQHTPNKYQVNINQQLNQMNIILTLIHSLIG